MSSDYSTSVFQKMHLLKIGQAIVSVVILSLCVYEMSIMEFNGLLVANATALLTFGVLIYYLVSLRTAPDLYKMFAIVVGDFIGIAAWLASCAALVAVYTVLLSYDDMDWPRSTERWEYDDTGCNGDYKCHEMLEFMSRDAAETFGPVLGVALIFTAVQVVLFCISSVYALCGLYDHCQGLRSVKLEEAVPEVRRLEKLE